MGLSSDRSSPGWLPHHRRSPGFDTLSGLPCLQEVAKRAPGSEDVMGYYRSPPRYVINPRLLARERARSRASRIARKALLLLMAPVDLLLALIGLPQIASWNKQHKAERGVGLFELDEPARALLARVQRAIDSILDSEINRTDLIDNSRNVMVLAQHEWEIALILRRQSEVRRRRATTDMPAAVTRSVEDRVRLIEDYAKKVRAADAEYTIDAHARPEIEDLTEQAEVVEQALRKFGD